MISTEQLTSLAGKTMHGENGEKIGKIVDVYESTDTDSSTFVTVATGLFGTSSSFVPLTRASLRDDDVVVPYDKALVKNAPRVAADEELTAEEEQRLYRHYQLSNDTSTSSDTDRSPAATVGAGAPVTAGMSGRQDADGNGVFDDVERRAVGHDTSGPTTDEAMTRTEERLRVGAERREAGRARLRKRIVTETQTRTVPVSHEEVRVEREPLTDANAAQAYDGPALSEEEHEVVLTEQRPVVDKETVPVERVRLDTATVTEQATVTEEVRKENIELDQDTPAERAR